MHEAQRFYLFVPAILGWWCVTHLSAESPVATTPRSTGIEEGKRDEPVSPDAGTAASRQTKREPEVRLSLEDAITIALRWNLGLRIARKDLQIRQRQIVIEKAVFDPFFNLGASYSKNRRPTASFLDIGGSIEPKVLVNPFEVTNYSTGLSGSTVLGTSYSISLEESGFDRPLAERGGIFAFNPLEEVTGSIQLSQPLLRGAWYDYNSAQLEIASNDERLSREELELTANNLVFSVEQAYWQLLAAIKNHEAKQNTLAVAEENLENVRKRRAVGTAADIDVVTVESQLALRKVEFNEAELLLQNARDGLLELLNGRGDTSFKARWQSREKGKPYQQVLVTPITVPSREAFLPDRDDSLQAAFENRPDYRQIDLQIENQKIRMATALNQMLPFLDLRAGWFQHGLDESIEGSFSSLGSGQFYSWTVGVEMRVSLSNRGPRNAYLQAKDECYKLELQRAQLENQIVLEIDASIRTLKSLRKRIEDLDRRVELQADLLDKEKKKLEAGKSIPYTVSIIENDLVDSQTEALRVKADYLIAQADHYRLTGRILTRHGVDKLLR